MNETSSLDALSNCAGVAEVLKQIGDKWTVQVVVALHRQARRFNEIKRHVPGISQQMLVRTLKALERDGMVNRTVHHTTPPQVEYSLTPVGLSLSEPVRQLAAWAIDHHEVIRDSRRRYDAAR